MFVYSNQTADLANRFQFHFPSTLRRSGVSIPTVNTDEIQGAISTATSEASRAQSAAQSAVTSISSINDILPINCSIGVWKYCVGYTQRTTCYTLPLNISRLMPDEALASMQDQISQVRTLVAALNLVSPSYLQIGLACLFLMAMIFTLDRLGCIRLPFRIICFAILGTVCLSLPLLSLAVLLGIRFKLKSTSIVGVLPRREAESLYIVAFCFTIGVLVLIGASLVPAKPNAARIDTKATEISTDRS